MEITTIQKYMHTSPRKLRLVADLVRKMSPVQALNVLKVTPKYAAKDLEKAISTVLANAKQVGLDVNTVIFKKLEVDESIKMRRFHAGTRGRVKPFKRRLAHIKIVVTDEIEKSAKSENQSISKRAEKVEVADKPKTKKEETK